MRVSPGKIRSAGAKSRVIGFASTRGHDKQPAETDFKVSHIRGKITDLATLFVGDVLSVRELHSLALCCQTHLDQPVLFLSSQTTALCSQTFSFGEKILQPIYLRYEICFTYPCCFVSLLIVCRFCYLMIYNYVWINLCTLHQASRSLDLLCF